MKYWREICVMTGIFLMTFLMLEAFGLWKGLFWAIICGFLMETKIINRFWE